MQKKQNSSNFDEKNINNKSKSKIVMNKTETLECILNKFDIGIWGKETVVTESIPTGSFLLDKITGIGGWPKGRIIEIFGADSSGKTTLALHAIAEAQKLGLQAVYLDLERTLHKNWAKIIGVDIDKLLISYPNSGEEAFSIIHGLVSSGVVDLIVVDSVAAMSPQTEIENNITEQTMGSHARLMSKGLRILQLINKTTTIIFINQIRDKIGTFFPVTTTTGGRALKYASSLRLEVKRCEAIKYSTGISGFFTKMTVIKNKMADPMRNVMLSLTFKTGFDKVHEVISEALRVKLVEQKGCWYYYKGQGIAQGINALKEHLTQNPQLFQEIKIQAFQQ